MREVIVKNVNHAKLAGCDVDVVPPWREPVMSVKKGSTS